jgi:hypothetical protein
MSTFPAITDSDLARARSDPAFRQRLLTQSLDMLLARMQKLRGTAQSVAPGDDKRLREGVELAVRLAELIQDTDGRQRGF